MVIAVIIALCVIAALSAAVFFLDPKLLEAFFDKADEWAEIIDNAKDEK